METQTAAAFNDFTPQNTQNQHTSLYRGPTLPKTRTMQTQEVKINKSDSYSTLHYVLQSVRPTEIFTGKK